MEADLIVYDMAETHVSTESTHHPDTSKSAAEIDTSQPVVEQAQAAKDVLAERQRQVSTEGWTPEHDDGHDGGDLAAAAAAYALNAADGLHPMSMGDGHGEQPTFWPWHGQWWKPKTPRQDLVRAAALILAEIERLDRAAAPQAGQQEQT
jgi:hypothetical protein